MYTYLFQKSHTLLVYNPSGNWWPLCSSIHSVNIIRNTKLKIHKLDWSTFDEQIENLADVDNCYIYDHIKRELIPYVQ